MQRALVVMVLLAGCIGDVDEPAPAVIVVLDPAEMPTLAEPTDDSTPDLCALAAALPTDNICSLACDPDAMVRRLVDEGMPGQRCYQLHCELSDEASVSVGVCLP